MNDLEKLKLYLDGLSITQKEIEIEEEFLAKNGEYSSIGSPQLVDRLRSNIEWYNEKISILKGSVREKLAERYEGIETLERFLSIDEKGVFWLYTIEGDKKGTVDECLGRNDDKFTLDLIPQELHEMTSKDKPVRVKVVKSKKDPHKRRMTTNKVFIDAINI